MQKRSNGTFKGIARYFVNDNRVNQPCGYCECRCNDPSPLGTSNGEEFSSMRYKRSLSNRGRSKRQLNRNLFVPNLENPFDIYHSFDDSEKNDDSSKLRSDKSIENPHKNRYTDNLPNDFQPVYVDRHSLPSPNKNRQDGPIIRQPPSKPQHQIMHSPSLPSYRVVHRPKPKRLDYNDEEFVVSPTHDKSETLPSHSQSPTDCEPVYFPKFVSKMQADYFACCDECRQKIIKKYADEGCQNCTKSLDPIDANKTPCEKHESIENLSQKCGCDHNKNILKNLQLISERLSQLSDVRSGKIQKKKKFAKSKTDVKKNLLKQLNKIYEKLSSLKSEDEIVTCSKKNKQCTCSLCKKGPKRSGN